MLKIFTVFLLISSCIFATTGSLDDYGGQDYFDSLTPRIARMAKEDGEWINIAELMMNPLFELRVTMGLVPGFSKIDKFGVNLNVTTSTDPEDIWEFGGVYPDDPFGTAPIKYVSSNDNTDIGQVVAVYGLDIEGEDTYQEVTTNGYSVVTLDTPLWMVYRMMNISDSGLGISGTLYCHTDSTPTSGVPLDANVRAIINDGKNQTLMTIYTIPKGKVGFLMRGEVGLRLEGNSAVLAEYADVSYKSKRLGKVFTVKKAISVFPGTPYQDKRAFPDVIPSLTVIKITADTVTQTMGLWATFDVLLVDEDYFSEEFLTNIGQPGY